MNKSLNSKCICGSGLIWKKYKLMMLEPCEHIIHQKCLKTLTKCPLCNVTIDSIESTADLHEKLKKTSLRMQTYENKTYQKYIDMISMTNFDNLYSGKANMFNMIDIVGIISSFPFLSGYDDGINGCKEVLSLMNSKIIVKGMKNINQKQPRVYIANHTSYLDFIVILYLLKCGFLSSSQIRESWIGKQIMNVIPLLVIERGKDKNTVEKMKKYVEKYGSLCLFPEGMITHPDTLIRFRTGAFYIGYPVYPVILRYDPIVYDTDIKRMIEKVSSQPELTIYVDILEAELPPFNEHKIEQVRKKMGKVGNLALSRVSNRDIKDTPVRLNDKN